MNNINLNEFKIISININHIKNKIDELRELIYLNNPEICLIQETHKLDEMKINIPKYDSIEIKAKGEESKNGLMIIIKNELKKNYIIETLNDYEIELAIYDENKKHIRISNIYIPCVKKKLLY